jgi:hypothetical protein
LAVVTLILQQSDKRTRLSVTQEYHNAYHGEEHKFLHSYRVVNTGSVNVQVVALRLVVSQSYNSNRLGTRRTHGLRRLWLRFRRRREVPLPKIEQEGWSGLREGEVNLPHNIGPGDRVRLTVETETLQNILENAGLRGCFVDYKIAVVDTLNRRHNTYGGLPFTWDTPEDY